MIACLAVLVHPNALLKQFPRATASTKSTLRSALIAVLVRTPAPSAHLRLTSNLSYIKAEAIL